eukprot:9492931-Lingulodinium_polyedra.AAC.1
MDVILPIDLENAYGRALRSVCLEAAQTVCPRTAALAAAQWAHNNTRLWQKCGSAWTSASTARGGWQ